MEIDPTVIDTAQASNATGSLSATVSPEGWVPANPFVATSVHFSLTDSTVGVLGMFHKERTDAAQDPDSTYLFLGFPADIKDGDYKIGAQETGVWAYLSGSKSGYATRGNVTGLKWDKQKNVMQATFDFDGNDENGQAFSVSGGAFDVSYAPVTPGATDDRS
jgi:hypothetical protein